MHRSAQSVRALRSLQLEYEGDNALGPMSSQETAVSGVSFRPVYWLRLQEGMVSNKYSNVQTFPNPTERPMQYRDVTTACSTTPDTSTRYSDVTPMNENN